MIRRLRLVVALAVLGLAAWPAGSGADTYGTYVCQPQHLSARDVVVLVHGGGFIWGTARSVDPACRAFARAGFHTINVEYTMRDIPAAMRDVRGAIEKAREAHRRGHVFCYGFSVGGTLVLDAAGLCDRVAATAPVTDLGSYLPRDWQAQFGYAPTQNPLAHRIESPALIQQDPADPTVPYAGALRLARRNPRTVRVEARPGMGHHDGGVSRAIRYFKRAETRRH